MAISQPRGVRDFGPGEAIAREKITAVIEETYKRFGFSPLETPGVELLDVLSAKAYGEETSKQIYKIDDDDSGLRFDLTIPMARYVAMNGNMPLPFRRYQIGQVWRRDEPQKMRYREFTQADVDVIGSGSVESDAEVIAAPAQAIEELGIKDFAIELNSRVFLDKILASFKVPQERSAAVIRAIDKLQKIGRDAVTEQIAKLGVPQRDSEKLLEFLLEGGDNSQRLESVAANIEGTKEEVEKARRLLELLSNYGVEENVSLQLSLARGLDYYTGFVWEYIAMQGTTRLPSVGSGGRYDNLIGIYARKGMPAVGSSIGIDRIYDLISGNPVINTYSKLFIACIGQENYAYALGMASRARGAGIYTDINIMERSLSKQLEYANALKVRYAMIIGPQEVRDKSVKLRDLVSGEEVALTADEAIEKINKGD
ncbi:MAG: histidine--tRNA ligase [Candidatus Micrarchaeota archaeon]|nr:histidine--tRNA ligase [Candidatus Micrarchaeota archaeon]MDE1847440.1 histidine--tRNA ligase [Candidatus Micrarchaeota archaeon]MDE1864065.1 histidine--tRNA ligase [Candidatus Micrarchaeota archaeon]